MLACFLCTAVTRAQEQERKPRIVISYAPNAEISDNIRGAFTGALYEGLQNSGKYAVFERNDFATVKQAEMEYQAQGHVKDADLLDAAKENGVEYVAYVTFAVIEERYRIMVKFANLQSGEAIGKPFNVTSKQGSDLFDLADEITKRLVTERPVTYTPKKSFFTCECAIDAYGERVKSDVSILNEQPLSYTEAIAFCKKKGDEWRLPTRVELYLIFSVRNLKDVVPFETRDYWTADIRNNYESYVINFGTRQDAYYSKNIRNPFRCIRIPD